MRCIKLCLLILFLSLQILYSAISSAQSLQGNKLKDSLKQELAHPKNDTAAIKTLYLLGVSYAVNDSAQAVTYANQLKQLAEKQQWQKGIGLYNLLMAKVYRNLGDNNVCLEYGRKAYLIFNNTSEKKYTAVALVFMANSYQATGFYTKSIENNIAALSIYEGMKDAHGIALGYNNIGVDYFYLHQYDKAVENYRKALVLREKEGDKFGIGSDLDNIALVYLDQKRYDSANWYNQQGIKMFEEVNDKLGLGRIYANRGEILMKLYDATAAYAYYFKSLGIDEKLGIDDGLSTGYGSVGDIYLTLASDSADKYVKAPFMKKDRKVLLDSAAFYTQKALVFADKAADISSLMNNNQQLATIEEQRNHYQSALTAHKKYTLYKDSIFNDENRQKIAGMESEHLTQTKDHEIALQAAETKRQALLKKVILIAAIAVVLFICGLVLVYNRRKKAGFDKEVMEVEMKALRAQMNPHFISNALHSINKYVMENDKKNASGYLTKFASLMRLILENSRSKEVPLEQDLHALELYLQLELLRFNNSFSYKIEVDPLIDQENTLVPPMLLQPFAENAILHGLHNKENGIVSIKVSKLNDMISCVIEDNGHGNINTVSAAHAEDPAHKSFGRKIINERLSIINRLKKAKASVNILQLKDASNKPGGIRVELLLPFELAF
ncbi:MAG: tetratricopeptide repeat protein [Chitinophagaceae bacterium]